MTLQTNPVLLVHTGKVFIDAVTDQQDALQMKGVAQPCLMVVVEKMLRDGKFSASHTKAVRCLLSVVLTLILIK